MSALGHTRLQRVLLRVALYGGALLVGIPLAFAFAMTRPPPRSTPAPPPPAYQERWLEADGLRLRAWLARGDPQRPAAVVAHGLGDSLESYLRHARPLRARGYSVLLVDLRGHGGSEGSLTALGGREHAEVSAAAAELRRAGLADRGIVFEGHSMGAVAVLLAAAREPDVRAVIVEAPYDSYRATIAHHAWLFYRLPAWAPMIPVAITAAEWRADFIADEVDAVAAAGRIDAPLLAIADALDVRMPPAVVRRVYDAHPGPKQLWVAPGVDHVGAITRDEYAERIAGFLDANGL